jgi:membrane protease YdiL (CAAX protease family)
VNPLLEEVFWRLYLYKLLPKTEGWKWGVSAMYAAYHVIVVLRFSYVSQALLSGLGLCLLGRVLVLVRETSGLLAACLLHSGLDTGLMGIWLYLLFVVS